MTIEVRIRGIRQSIPSGYVIGRTSSGTGDAELLTLGALARGLNATGQLLPPSAGVPAVIDISISGKPTDNRRVPIRIPYPMRVPESLTGSGMVFITLPAAQVQFNMAYYRAGAFHANAGRLYMEPSGAVSRLGHVAIELETNDLWIVDFPTPQDVTLADGSISLLFDRI